MFPVRQSGNCKTAARPAAEINFTITQTFSKRAAKSRAFLFVQGSRLYAGFCWDSIADFVGKMSVEIVLPKIDPNLTGTILSDV